MRIAVLFLFINCLPAISHWETKHYETTDNGFMDASAPDSLVGWLVGVRDQVGGILYNTTDGGNTWQEFRPWTIQQCMFTFALQFTNMNTGYITAMGLINNLFPAAVLYKTSDGGSNWNRLYGLTINFIGVLWDDVFFIDANNGWLAGARSDIRRTDNGGTSWTTQTAPDTGLSFKSIYFINPNEGWIVGGDYDSITGRGTRGVIVHTTNSGTQWNTQMINVPRQFYSVHFINNLNGWVCGYKDSASPGIFMHTTNGGNNWVEILAPPVSLGPYGLYAIDFPDPMNGFAVGGGNRWNTQGSHFAVFLKTTNGGSNWFVDTAIFVNSPWGVAPLGMDMYSAKYGYAGGTRLSAFRYTPIAGKIEEYRTSVNKPITFITPLIVRDRLKISLIVTELTQAEVSIFDITGRIRKTIGPKTLLNGSHSIPVNLDLENGLYFCRLKTSSGITFSRKFIVIK